MRELAIKKSQLASALVNDEAEDQIEGNTTSIKRLFHGWLREVPSPQNQAQLDLDQDSGIRRIFPATTPGMLNRQPSSSREATLQKKWRILTIREVLGLTRATVRESVEHRTWPPEVVLKFMAAEVVTRKR